MNNIIKNSTCGSVQQSFIFPSEPVIPGYIMLKKALRDGSLRLGGRFSHEYPNYNMEDWNFQGIVQESKQSLFISNLSKSFEKALSKFNKKNLEFELCFAEIKDDFYKDFIACLWLLHDFGITISSGEVSLVCRKLFLYIDYAYLYDLLTHPDLEIFKDQPSTILYAIKKHKDPKATLLGWKKLYESLLVDKDLEIFKDQPSTILYAIKDYADPKATLLGWKNLYESLLVDKDLKIFKDQPSAILRAITRNTDPKATLLGWKKLYDSLLADEDLEIFKDQPSTILYVIKGYKDPKATLLGWKNLYESLLVDKDLELFKDQPSTILFAIKQHKDPKATLLGWKKLYDSLLADEELEIFKDQSSVILFAIKNYADPKATLLGWKNLYESLVDDEDLELFKDQPSTILFAITRNKDPKATLLGWKKLYDSLLADEDLEIFKDQPSMILHAIKGYADPKATLFGWKNLYESLLVDKDLEIFKDQPSTILFAIKVYADPKATLLGWKKSVLGMLEKRSIASLPQLQLLSGGRVNLSFLIALISRLMQTGQSGLERFYLELLEHQHSLYIKSTSVVYKGLRYDSMQEAVVAQIFVAFGFSIVVGKTYQVAVNESKKSIDFRFGDWYVEYHPLVKGLSRGDLRGEAYEEYKNASQDKKDIIKKSVKRGYVQSREDLLPTGADLTVIAEWKLLDCLRHLYTELQHRFADKCAELCIAEFDQFKKYFFYHMSLVQEAKNTQDMHNIELQNLCDDNLFDDDIDMDREC